MSPAGMTGPISVGRHPSDETQPDFVIFPAGHDHEHPTANTAQRYIDDGVNVDNIFRTDR